ncbi:ABC transporter ATP-binding protein [Halanaerobiaceae bacterium Z-7014]|uniref:ABC transporter ATP-binding protein n=1 Tax=Halonatronomonas betaini TaxID=2778430 RepID=A0A931AWI6_9FIRM|nr:ABC transporter ATP-binding protein [Halonatronomonas betaini]MBF8437810.1 ABC transporter ATP-binding protein [Halonatronomonas betaini]
MIEVKDLRKVFKNGEIEVEALKGVSYTIEDGEFVAIMGPSGSGKSTMMHLLGCLDQATSGKYFLAGTDVGELDDNQLAIIRNEKVGFVFQQFNLLARTSISKNVEVPMIYKGVSRKERKRRAEEMLTKVGLEHRMDHNPNEISGGQKQRVAIARALVNNPDLILADEPTGNLDTKTGDEIMELFQELNDQGHTIIIVTHEPPIAEQAKRIINLRDGLISSDEVIA